MAFGVSTSYVTRKRMVAFVRKYRRSHSYLAQTEAALIRVFDRLAPGWKRVKLHFITIENAPYNNGNCDIVHELPGGLFLRGWDYTGAINHPSWTRGRL